MVRQAKCARGWLISNQFDYADNLCRCLSHIPEAQRVRANDILPIRGLVRFIQTGLTALLAEVQLSQGGLIRAREHCQLSNNNNCVCRNNTDVE